MEYRKPTYPLIRVYAFGEFTLERLVPQASEEAATQQDDPPIYERIPTEVWQSRGPALKLLKVLLCRPRRQATRYEIIEALWSEDEQKRMKNVHHACESAVSLLRNVLRTYSGENLLHLSEGASYHLPDQHCLWVDADAFEVLVSQAIRTQDAFMLWQQAQQLVRGTFLEDHSFDDWARVRRQILAADQSRMISGLAGAYIKEGRFDEADEVLQQHIAINPTDEDALCLLMSLLEQQGKYRTAWKLYIRAREVSKQDDISLAPRTHALAKHLREKLVSSEVAPMHHLLEVNQPSKPIKTASETIYAATPVDEQFSLQTLTSLPHAQGIIGVVRELGGKDMDSLRRQLLKQLLGVAGTAIVAPLQLPELDWEKLKEVFGKPSQLDDEILSNLEAINSHFWSVYLTASSKSSVRDGVIGQLNTLIRFLNESPSIMMRKRLYALSSELSQLAGEIYFDTHDYSSAQTYYTLAIDTAKEAELYDLWACALVRNAFLPIYDERYEDALPLLQEARTIARRGDTSLPTRFWVSGVEAEVQSGVKNLMECQDALDRAYGIFGLKGKNLAWVRFDGLRLPALRGACFTRLQQPNLAIPVLQEALHSDLYQKPGRKRGMVLLDLAEVSLQQQEVEEACAYTKEAIDIAIYGASGFLRGRIYRLRYQMASFADSVLVKNLDEQLRMLV